MTAQPRPGGEALPELARTGNVDLVIVPAGYDGVSLALQRRLVHEARCPVLLVRSGARAGGVLVAVSPSNACEPALAMAVTEARRRGARLTAVYCRALDDTLPQASVDAHLVLPAPDGTGPPRDLATNRVIVMLESLAVVANLISTYGDPAIEVVRQAGYLDAELVVVSAALYPRRHPSARGSFVEEVAVNAACSVLVVSDGAASASLPDAAA
jgi:nucleotide-binding universal stress UspA family protein